MRDIPETIRKEAPSSNYRPSNWKPYPKTYNTRSRACCQPGVSTPKGSSSEDSDSDEDIPSPSTTAASHSRSGRGKGSKHQSSSGHERTQPSRKIKQSSSRNDGQSTRPYCTMACIHGIVIGGPLDKECPNLQHHGGQRHPMGPREFTRKLHR